MHNDTMESVCLNSKERQKGNQQIPHSVKIQISHVSFTSKFYMQFHLTYEKVEKGNAPKCFQAIEFLGIEHQSDCKINAEDPSRH